MTVEESTGSAPEPSTGPVFLVVDDDPMVRRILTRGLSQLDPAAIFEEEDGLAAQSVLRETAVDVVVTDLVMPHMDGLELMKWAQQHCPGPLWIVLSGVETFDTAVEALQLGAFDYLAKPPEIPRLRVAVRNALDKIGLARERRRLYAELEDSNVQLAEKVTQLQKVCRVLEEQAAVIQADLDRAEVIQRALLPQEPPSTPGWCLETLYRPGSSVGGDFYDVVELGQNQLGLVIADAAGHGVAAAMLSVLFKLRLRQADGDGGVLQPQQVLENLNHSLYHMLTAPGAFITATYILIDLDSGAGRLASAGHPPCILSSRGGDARLLTRTGPAIGLEANPSFREHLFQLEPGDRLMLYTDGVVEGGPHSPTTDVLGQQLARMDDRAELLGSFFDAAMRDQVGERDDITMVLLERSEGSSHFNDSIPVHRQAPVDTEEEAAPATTQPHLARGTAGNQGLIAIVGSITWLCSHSLLENAHQLLERYESLILDLSQCEHMDSTCLGTLHEIVVSNPDRVCLQAVSAEVCKLFDELSMSAVLEHIRADATPLPENMTAVETASLSPRQQGARILSAHETLTELSDDNREQFQAVVDSLRADLD